MKLDDALAGIGALGFDTAPIAYFVEAHPRYDVLWTTRLPHPPRTVQIGLERQRKSQVLPRKQSTWLL